MQFDSVQKGDYLKNTDGELWQTNCIPFKRRYQAALEDEVRLFVSRIAHKLKTIISTGKHPHFL